MTNFVTALRTFPAQQEAPGHRTLKPWYVSMAVASLLVFSQSASALTLDFNETVAPGDADNVNPSYSLSGFTLTSISGTSIYLLDPEFDLSNAPPDSSDFFTIEGGDPTAVELTSSNPTFSLQRFDAAAIYDDPAGDLTVTGNLSGGGSLVEVFAIPSGSPSAVWATYTLPASWVNLTSVTFEWQDRFAGLDNIVVDEPGATATSVEQVPVMPFWLLCILSGLIGFAGLGKLRRQ